MRLLLLLLTLTGLHVFAQSAREEPRVPPPQPGQLQNTFTAPPLTSREKFHYRVVELFTIHGFAGNAFGAAIGQAMDIPSEWGGGWTGYGDRFASGVGGSLVRQSIAFGLDVATHTDPRYFPSTKPGWKPRIVNILKQTVMTKRDDGSTAVAYGRVVGAFAAGQIVNAWQPRSNNSFTDGIERGLISLSADAGEDLLEEIVTSMRPKPFRHKRLH